MTNEQASWLGRNKPYRPLGNTPSGYRWAKQGILHADGTFDLTPSGKRPAVRMGSFEVGILQEANSFVR